MSNFSHVSRILLKNSDQFNLDEEAECPGRFNGECPSNWEQPTFGMVPVGFSIVSTTLSVVGAILTIIPYLLWKDVRTGIRRIITFLAVADLFTALSYLIGTLNYIVYHYRADTESEVQPCQQFNTVCQIQSFLSCWFSVSSFLWTAVLALYLYNKINHGDVSKINKWFPLINVITWGLPIIMIFPLLAAGYLGFSVFAAGGWCFVKAAHKLKSSSSYRQFHLSMETILTILAGGKAVEILIYIWVMVLFCRIFYKIHKKKSQRGEEQEMASQLLRQVEKKLYAIPIAFIMLRIWGTLQFLLSTVVFSLPKIASTGCLPKYLFYIYYCFAVVQSIGDGGQGWCNFLLYVLWSQKIRGRMLINPIRVCCLEATKYFMSSVLPSENYGIINEGEGESSNSSIKFRRNLFLGYLNNANEDSRLLDSDTN